VVPSFPPSFPFHIFSLSQAKKEVFERFEKSIVSPFSFPPLFFIFLFFSVHIHVLTHKIIAASGGFPPFFFSFFPLFLSFFVPLCFQPPGINQSEEPQIRVNLTPSFFSFFFPRPQESFFPSRRGGQIKDVSSVQQNSLFSLFSSFPLPEFLPQQQRR